MKAGIVAIVVAAEQAVRISEQQRGALLSSLTRLPLCRQIVEAASRPTWRSQFLLHPSTAAASATASTLSGSSTAQSTGKPTPGGSASSSSRSGTTCRCTKTATARP